MSNKLRARSGAIRLLASLTLAATSAVSCWAQTPAAAPSTRGNSVASSAASPLSLQAAYQAAAALQPWNLARSERTDEQRLRERLADAWLADNPTVAAGVKAGNRDGLREFEIELSAPIATPARRALQTATAHNETAAYQADTVLQSLKLAGEVRAAYWAVLLAQSERAAIADELQRAEQLAADTERRTQAGYSARVDTLQAMSVVQATRASLLDADLKLTAARQSLRGLIGDAAMGELSDAAEPQRGDRTAALANHPAILASRQSVQLARARFNEASGVIHAPPTVSLTLANERSNGGNGSAGSTSARVGISIPLGGAQRASSRIALANAELTEAQANAGVLQRQVESEAGNALAALSIAERRIAAASERARLANEAADLYARAYRLGELDLPARLRSEGERSAAHLALDRARIELKQAQSRANQSLGLLP